MAKDVMPRLKRGPGDRFNRLVITGLDHVGKYYQKFWKCKCDCGKELVVANSSLTNGDSQSCGCYHSEVVSKMMRAAKTTHGESGSIEYETWLRMMNRCRNPKSDMFHRYGGRGIKVCERWKVFENFFEDMGRRPHGKTSIGRIDNNLGYFPSNCRWEDSVEQARNTVRNEFITYNGVTATVAEWAEKTGVNYGTLLWRFHKKWPVEAVIHGRI